VIVKRRVSLASTPRSQVTVDFDKDKGMQIPCLTNPAKVPMNTMLVALDDLMLQKIAKDVKPKK
jgi:hypothetical protein